MTFIFSRKMIAENAFSEMDINQDGKVTEDEFVKAVLKHQVTNYLINILWAKMEISAKTFCKMYVKLTTDDRWTTILFAVFWVSRLQIIFLASCILHKALYVMMYLRAFYYYFVHRKQHWCLQWKSFKFLIRIWMPLQNTSDVIGDVIKHFSNYSLSY